MLKLPPGGAGGTAVTRTSLLADAPGVDEVADGQPPRQRVLQPLGVHHQVVVQETCVGVERRHLLGAGLHHVGVAVAHWGGAGTNRPQTPKPRPLNTRQSGKASVYRVPRC